jgi:hypothetical protein
VTTEYAGITIIIDQGPRRTVVNVPHAEDVRVDAVDDRRRRDDLCPPFSAPPIVDEPVLMRLNFRPIGEYTLREERNPMHPTAPALSEHEQAEADRFGIHDDDESEGVW